MSLPRPDQIGGRTAEQRYGFLCGVTMQKAWTELFQIECLLNEFHFDRIVELGTGSGGTTIFLGLQGILRNIPVYSFDIGSNEEAQRLSARTKEAFRRIGVVYEEINVFDHVESIGHIINGEGRTLLYNDCGGTDGGKSETMLSFGRFLKEGDVVLVHDYDTQEFSVEVAKSMEKIIHVKPYEESWFRAFDAKHGAFIR